MNNKRQHFPIKMAKYFTEAGDYPPALASFEEEYLNDAIIHHCCAGDTVTTLPPLTEELLTHLRNFQATSLVKGHNPVYVAPSMMLELMCIYMETIFEIRPSTIPGAGNGLFWRPGKSLPADSLLPYSGSIVSGSAIKLTSSHKDDKLLWLRRNRFINGAVQYSFSITGNQYMNYIAMANEIVCHDMVDNNTGKIINSEMDMLTSIIEGNDYKEVFVLYQPLSTELSALKDEPYHRRALKRKNLYDMFSHLDDCFIGVNSYMINRIEIRSKALQLRDGLADINDYRAFGKKPTTVDRYIFACMAVIDGRFDDYLKHGFPQLYQAVRAKSSFPVDFTSKGKYFIPECLLKWNRV